MIGEKVLSTWNVKEFLSERGTLVGGQKGSQVLRIRAESVHIVQDTEVQTDGSKEEEIRFLACCNRKQQ